MLRLFFFTPTPPCLDYILNISCCICGMMVRSRGVIVDAALVAVLAAREGLKIGDIIGAAFDIGVVVCA